MISKHLQKEDAPILERSRIENRFGQEAAGFLLRRNAELVKTSISGRDPIPAKALRHAHDR
jgi:hypothetical protein